MKKKYVVLGVLVVLVIVLLLIFNTDKNKQLKKKLYDNKYSMNNYGLFTKNIGLITQEEFENSTNDILYDEYFFDVDNYEFYRLRNYKYQNIKIYLSIDYLYKTNKLTFNEQALYQNGNVSVMGSYDGEFICDVVYHHGFSDFDKTDICSQIELDIQDFITEKNNIGYDYEK